PRRCAEISGSSGADIGADIAVAGSGRARPRRYSRGWAPGINDGWAAMIGESTLLASAFVVPLGMLLACLWPQVLNRMPSLLAVAPVPALTAVLLVATDSSLAIGSARFHLTFAIDRPGAMLLGVSGLLWTASGAYASQYLQGRPNRGRFVVCWLMTLTGCV